jgi:hypothetical protein
MNNLLTVKYWDFLLGDVISDLTTDAQFGVSDLFALLRPSENKQNVYQDLIYDDSLLDKTNLSNDVIRSLRVVGALCVLNTFKRLFEDMISKASGEDSVVSLFPDMVLGMSSDLTAVTESFSDKRFPGANVKVIQVVRNRCSTLALLTSIYAYSRIHGVRKVVKNSP